MIYRVSMGLTINLSLILVVFGVELIMDLDRRTMYGSLVRRTFLISSRNKRDKISNSVRSGCLFTQFIQLTSHQIFNLLIQSCLNH